MSASSESTARSHSRQLWIVLLAGPVIGYSCFWFVYLVAEASCTDEWQLLGSSTLRTVLLATSALSALAVLVYAWRTQLSWRDETDDASGENRRFMGTAGLILSGLFLVFLILIGAPVAGTTLC